MRNASKMARYMMMRTGREADHGEKEYGYDDDKYSIENRFRDRRGREHYDNGRFAPKNGIMLMESDYYGPCGRHDGSGTEYDMNRRGREGETRRMEPNEMRSNWNDDDGARKNIIGFDRPRELPSHYPTRIDYAGGDETAYRSGAKMAGGAMGAGMEFTEDIAKEWTSKMHNEDGTKGEHWNMDQVKKLMMQRGVQYNTAEIYAVMNALYSDYCKVFKKYGFNSPEAYLDLALAWLNDSDAVPNKAMMYYECIVKH